MATHGNGIPKFETVRYETKGAICHIVLNRPEKLNAATDQLVEEVNDALFEFDADPELRVAILSGAGRAFCSGADVQQRQLRTREELRRLGGPAGRRSRENGLADAVNWKPVIAAVHGWALGLGYSLSQSCDLVVAAAGTKFQIREVQRGLGGAQHWVATWFWTGSRFANGTFAGQLTVGGTYGFMGIANSSVIAFLPAQKTLQLFNGYIEDQVVIFPERVRLTFGSKLEHNDYSGWEVMPSSRLAWTPDDHQTFWGAISRAVRSPSRIDAEFFAPPPPAPANTPKLIGGPDFGILGEGYLRLSYANSIENIVKALDRMGEFLASRKVA